MKQTWLCSAARVTECKGETLVDPEFNSSSKLGDLQIEESKKGWRWGVREEGEHKDSWHNPARKQLRVAFLVWMLQS